MESLYLYSVAIGGVLLIGQFLLGLLGFIDDLDVDDFSDTDVDSGFDSSDHASGGWFVGIFSLRSVFSALTVFGLVGMGTSKQFPDSPITAITIAGIVGFGVLYMVGWLIKTLYRIKSSGTAKIENTLGENGTVYLKIPGNNSGKGKVTVIVQNRSMEFEAMTSEEEIPTGASIHVLEVISPGVLEVALADPKEETTPESEPIENR